MKVRIVVPRRSDGGHRDRLWEFCRAHWRAELPDFEIVEGHHHEGPFNRSAAINDAAKGEWDVAVILDGDTLLDPETVVEAVIEAERTRHLVLPFRVRKLLSQKGTDKILAGATGSWEPYVEKTIGTGHVSSCVVVPRSLWDEVGGFDERFEGWGGEDDAFHAACNALCGVKRPQGEAWHLWHDISPWRDHRAPTYRQALALSNRYVAAKTPAQMAKLLAEPRDPSQVAVVALTTGRRDTLAAALASAEENLIGPVGRRVLCLDAGTAALRRKLQSEYPDWEVEMLRGRGGYAQAVAQAIDVAMGSGQPWIFWLEDDFTFTAPVPLLAMQALMDREPHLAQLSLMRQAWYPHEVEAGGVVAAKPEAFTQCEGYVEHRDYWTMNPMLVRRSFLAEHPWVRRRDAEAYFGAQLFENPELAAGILGAIDDAPRVIHIGQDRAGHGY